MQFEPNDLAALNQAILALHEYKSWSELYARLPHVLVNLIGGVRSRVMHFDVSPAELKMRYIGQRSTGPASGEDPMHRMYMKLADDHPFIRHWLSRGEAEPVMMSDFFTDEAFERTLLYQHFYAQSGLYRLLATAAIDGRACIVMGVSRAKGEPNFTERDRTLLALLRPHVAQLKTQLEPEAEAPREARPEIDAYGLTPRELEVAHWLARGKSNPEIATILASNQRTVEKHVERILAKLGVENRTAASLMLWSAERQGVSEPD